MLIEQLSKEHEVLITLEEGSSGGFGASVMTQLAQAGKLQSGAKIFPMTLPDAFISHGSPQQQYEEAGLMSKNIVETALKMLGISKSDLERPTEAAVRKIYAAK